MSDALPEELVSGGDCFLHWHSSDRQIDHANIVEMQSRIHVREVTTGYTLNEQDDIVLCDTIGGSITITLPRCFNGKEFQIVKIDPANTVTVTPDGTDTIMGDTSGTLLSNYESWHIKATDGGDWILL
jgi:hypothetical protein